MKIRYQSREIGQIYRSASYSFELLLTLEFKVLGKLYLVLGHSDGRILFMGVMTKIKV